MKKMLFTLVSMLTIAAAATGSQRGSFPDGQDGLRTESE